MSYYKLCLFIVLISLVLHGCTGSTPTPVAIGITEEPFSPFGELLEGESDEPPLESVFAPLVESGQYLEQEQLQNEILTRAQNWVDQKVPYSTEINPEWGYRTDCSGFVSYAWGLQPGTNGGLTTATLQNEAQTTKLVSIEELQPGDILNAHNDNTQHVVLFGGWLDKDKHTFLAYEQNGYFRKAISRELQLEQRKDGLWYLPGERSIDNGVVLGEGPYLPYRLIMPEVLGASAEQILPPAEGWIAFVNKNNIWLIRPDGSELTQVTNNNSEGPRVQSFRWSPDGNSLAYSLSSESGKAILVYDIQASDTRTVVTDDVGGGFDWSLSGKQIIYDTSSSGDIPSQMQNKGLWVVNLENERMRQVIESTSEFPFITEPRWSSQGSHILFTLPCFEIGCTGQGVAVYDTGAAINLPVNGAWCDWAPNDLQIACLRAKPDNNTGIDKGEIVIMDENGNISQNISLADELTALATLKWSANGETLLLGYYSQGKGQTDTVSLETGERKHLASGIASGTSPDGQRILTWESGINVPTRISIVNAISKEAVPLTEGMMGAWQPSTGVLASSNEGLSTVIPGSFETLVFQGISSYQANTDVCTCDECNERTYTAEVNIFETGEITGKIYSHDEPDYEIPFSGTEADIVGRRDNEPNSCNADSTWLLEAYISDENLFIGELTMTFTPGDCHMDNCGGTFSFSLPIK